MRTLVLLTSVAALLAVPAVDAADASGEPRPRCRGHVATIVGAPGRTVVGTAGRDVVVTNGATDVRVGAGDDVVCTTGTRGHVVVDADRGDDVVDRSADRNGSGLLGSVTATVALGPGRDLFVGDDVAERVTAGGRDRVLGNGTGEFGRDEVYLGGRHDGPASGTVRLLPSGDPGTEPLLFFQRPPARGFDVDGGGTAYVDLDRLARGGRWRLDLAAGTVTRDGALHGRLAGVGELHLRAEGPDGPRVEVRGTDGPDVVAYAGRRRIDVDLGEGDDRFQLSGIACTERLVARVAAGGGTDRASLFSRPCPGAVPAIDLTADALTLGGTTVAVVGDVEDAALFTGALTSTLTGDDGPNRLELYGCGGTVRGGDGDDVLTITPGLDAFGVVRCPGRSRNRLLGEGGDDDLSGETSRPLVMVGGDGDDSGDGYDEDRDTCDTEVRTECRLP